MSTPKRWFEVQIETRLREEDKERTSLRNQIHALSKSEACRIGIRQLLASRSVHAIFSAYAR